MVVIFGWGAGEAKDLGEVAPARCPNCGNDVFLHHIRSEKRVSLYFVPLAPYGSDEYLACPICRQGMQVRPEQRMAIDKMRAATHAFRRGAVPSDHYLGTVREFWARLGVSPSGQQVVQPPARLSPDAAGVTTLAPAVVPAPTLAEQLTGLARLHEDGVLTDEEFAAAKGRVLGKG